MVVSASGKAGGCKYREVFGQRKGASLAWHPQRTQLAGVECRQTGGGAAPGGGSERGLARGGHRGRRRRRRAWSAAAATCEKKQPPMFKSESI